MKLIKGVIALLLAAAGLVAGQAGAATAITVNNFSFDDVSVASPGAYIQKCPDGWTCTNWDGGIYYPTSTQFPPGNNGLSGGKIVPDGNTVAFAPIGSNSAKQTLSQTTATTIANNTTYTLDVWLGRRNDSQGNTWASHLIQLWAGGSLIASSTPSAPTQGYWQDYNVSYTSSANDTYFGQTIEIRLTEVFGGSNAQTSWDNVTLTSVPAVGSQTITFGALGGKAYGDAPFTVSATASSGLTVAFTSQTTGVCTVSGTTVTLVAGGTCTIAADQAGNGTYTAAAQVTQSFTVAQLATAVYVTTDTATLGNWKGVYGADGYSIEGDSDSLPGYASLSVTSAAAYTWDPAPTDARATQRGGTGRIAATWFTSTSYTFNLGLPTNAAHQIALYALDWDSGGRVMTLEVHDAGTDVLLDTRTISGFYGGKWVVWNITGAVTIKVINNNNNVNATVSAVMFAPVVVSLNVNLTAPADGATYTAPATVNLAATATAGTGSISKVEFYRDGVLIGTDTTAPYTYSDASLALGAYSYTAKAYDDVGNVTSAASVVQVSHASGSTNVALQANGGLAWATSLYNDGDLSHYAASNANNGERNGTNWGTTGGWNSTYSPGDFPHWFYVDFDGMKTIGEIDVFTLQDNYGSPSTPTLSTTFISYGITYFEVQYYDGFAWTTVSGGNVTGNDKVWRQFIFSPVTTDRIRLYITHAADPSARLTEIEAWTLGPTVAVSAPANGATYATNATVNLTATATASAGSVSKVEFYRDGTLIGTDTTAPYVYSDTSVPDGTYAYTAKGYDDSGAATSNPAMVSVRAAGTTNVALQANGGVASASDTYNDFIDVNDFGTAGANNGDRTGVNYGNGGVWLSEYGSGNFPHWLQMTFSGSKTISEIDVFMLQDRGGSPLYPSLTAGFNRDGLIAFDVEYWNGAAWTAVTGGNVTGNDKVWRQFTFSPITTDRIRVYVASSAGSADQVFAILAEVEAWAVGGGAATLDHFAISTGGAAASTCSPKNITITAQDVSNATLTGYTGTITLSTLSSHGDWAIVTGAGSLSNGTADDGAATYTFAAGDHGVVTLSLTDTHADDLTITGVDGAVSSTSSTLNFRDNAFIVSVTDSLGTTAVAARDHAMKAEMWKKDAGTGVCAVDTKYTGNKNLDAWFTADADYPGGAVVPTLKSGTPFSCGSPTLALSSTVPSSNPASNNFTSVPFSNGVWNFCLSTSDVGKYTLSLRDDTRAYATGTDISGASGTLTVRPFGLAITDVKKGATTNPAGIASAGSKFAVAGNTSQAAAQFEATVNGYLWQSGDDANNDGVPDSGANLADNTIALHFDWTTALSAANTSPYFTPGGATLGTLTGTTTITTGSYYGGSAAVTDLAYSEVGSFQLQAAVANYLNSSGVNVSGVNVNAAGTATQIGRFYPDHFTLTSSSLTAACGGFTYMGQANLGVAYIVEARNSANVKTSNYGTGYLVGTLSMLAENADNGTNLSSRLTVAGGTWGTGSYSANTSVASLSRGATPDGPFDSLKLGVLVTDGDGAVLASPDMNPATAGACAGACTGVALSGTTKIRFGRLRLQNASGSQLIAMPIPMQVQYWNGNTFVPNTLDSCTAVSSASVALGNYQKNLNTGETTATAGGTFSAGIGSLRLSAPGSNNNGSVDVSVNLSGTTAGASCTPSMPSSTATSLSYLQGTWCDSTYTHDPTSRATFGIFNTTSDFVYFRENF